MKKCAMPRPQMALHEAGHLAMTSLIPGLNPGEFRWHRLQCYEIAHVEPIWTDRKQWERSADRNEQIVSSVVIALAGGAAEWCANPEFNGRVPAHVIYRVAGGVDFELAHEWLTLQRYDPNQAAIESEIERLFGEVCAVFSQPAIWAAVLTICERILSILARADESGASDLHVPTSTFLDGLEFAAPAKFELKTTLRGALAYSARA